jgi:hypothetical protein
LHQQINFAKVDRASQVSDFLVAFVFVDIDELGFRPAVFARTPAVAALFQFNPQVER